MNIPQQTNQIDSTSGLAINCRNCEHCEPNRVGVQYDTCKKTGGIYCDFVHQFPRLYGHLCKNYSSWTPRRKSIFELIYDRIYKFLSST